MRHENSTTNFEKVSNSYHTGYDLNRLIITEIYASVQGESSYTGKPCTFVRLTGCPLRCKWCDTSYGFEGGEELTVEQVIAKVMAFGIPLVEVTGGEPLSQPAAPFLMQRLIDEGFQVLLETSGSETLAEVPRDVHVIMDLKCPDSRMSERNLWDNLKILKQTDEIKFVVASYNDFQWAADIIRQNELDLRFQVLISPAFGLVKPRELVEWILKENLSRVRLNLQIHKFIWSPRTKGV